MDSKKEMLLQRGFSEYDIDTNLEHYSGEWNILTITKEQAAAAKSARQLEPLFAQDSVDNRKMCATYIGRSFIGFAKDNAPFTVAPSQLDPYIARICRAVNEIGVCTCMSCDGWHKRGTVFANMELYMKDRYSVIWFWLITEHIFGEKWHGQDCYKGSWRNIWEPFDFEQMLGIRAERDMMRCCYHIQNPAEAKAVFAKNNSYAVFLEKHKDAFLEIRKRITDTLTEKIRSGEIADIDEMGFLEVRRCMCKVFLPEALPLAEAFSAEFPGIIRENSALYIAEAERRKNNGIYY